MKKLLCFVFICFALVNQNANAEIISDFNNLSYIYRVDRIIGNIWALEKKDNADKVYLSMLELKDQLEDKLTDRISISLLIEKAGDELKANGFKKPKKDLEEMRKAIKRLQKIEEKHLQYLKALVEGYEIHESALSFEAKHKQEAGPKELPYALVYSISLIIDGLMVLDCPINACKPWGDQMLTKGVIMYGEYLKTID